MNLKLTALVIDDSRVMRNMVMETLRRTELADFTFVEAEDGRDALAKMAEHAVHIAFVDWNMPNMSGIDFIRAARTLAYEKYDLAVPMVMVTSERMLCKVEEAMDDAGADGFISKPFTADEMKRKAAKAVEKAVAVQLRKIRQRTESDPAGPPKSRILGRLFG